LAITESWLSGDYHNNNTIAEILNTLNDFNFHHVPRVNRTGGGVGVFLRKGFTVLKNEWQPFSSMECMDLFISSGRSSIRLITIYRPPQSKKNRATPSTFFQEFSSLLEVVSLTPGYLLLNGDFNFHMELQNDAHASTFRELLQSAGLRHHVTKTTHRSGHTLDLIIDRQESKIISNVYTVTDLPSDHNAVLCSIALERPKASKSHFKYRKLKNIDMNAVKADILNSSLHSQTPETANADVNHLTKEYNSILQEVINRHAPEVSRSIFLRPNAPWFNDSLRALKGEKRKCERKYLTTGLEIHRQIFRDKCRTYTTTLNSV
jgi:hypothetical protein